MYSCKACQGIEITHQVAKSARATTRRKPPANRYLSHTLGFSKCQGSEQAHSIAEARCPEPNRPKNHSKSDRTRVSLPSRYCGKDPKRSSVTKVIILLEDISVVTLKRTDTTLDLSQMAKRFGELKVRRKSYGIFWPQRTFLYCRFVLPACGGEQGVWNNTYMLWTR
ncbi:hypothetical protein BZL39_M04390 [Zygosaccharomyces parabailii]|nr:hypothetical protein BZL39_M04390 [Zygosaccharomyces parabailii]CDH10102.1 uncharacterized protein ZBAI_01887 [Zygosaccharomyces bailii ISA1307]